MSMCTLPANGNPRREGRGRKCPNAANPSDAEATRLFFSAFFREGVARPNRRAVRRVERGHRRVVRHLLQHGRDGPAVHEPELVPGGLPEHRVERLLEKRGGLAVGENRGDHGEHARVRGRNRALGGWRRLMTAL
jgi:hypothetical protein